MAAKSRRAKLIARSGKTKVATKSGRAKVVARIVCLKREPGIERVEQELEGKFPPFSSFKKKNFLCGVVVAKKATKKSV